MLAFACFRRSVVRCRAEPDLWSAMMQDRLGVESGTSAQDDRLGFGSVDGHP
jgi:hypothetical protein